MICGLHLSAKSFLCMATVVLLLLFPCCFAAFSYQQTKTEPRTIEELSDDEVFQAIASRQWDQATEAVRELFKRGERVIPLLMKMKGDKRPFWGKLVPQGTPGMAIFVPSGNDANDRILMKEGKFVTVEVAALYLITAIYEDSLSIAGAPYLTDYSLSDTKRGAANTDKLIKRAWKSVNHWLIELNKEGMAALRAKERGPLDEANLGFW